MFCILTFYIICLFSINVGRVYMCSIAGDVMNCENEGLTNCPNINTYVNELNVDGNNIINFDPILCGNWSNLTLLSINRNKLKLMVKFDFLKNLKELRASHNELDLVFLEESLHINYIDLSYNHIMTITLESLPNLKSLICGHNIISTTIMSFILDAIKIPLINTLDLSYNNIVEIPNTVLHFRPSYFSLLNLAGNKISEVSFEMFNSMKRNIKLNLSYNNISNITLVRFPSIYYLDLSYNRISFISAKTISFMFQMEYIDLSNNPFNCSCDFRPEFIDLMNIHKFKFVNQENTYCKDGGRTNIFSGTCFSDNRSSPWRWLAPLIIIVLIGLVILFVNVGLLRRRHFQYIELEESHLVAGCLPRSWCRVDCFEPRNVEVPSPESSSTMLGNQRLDFERKLIVLCSSRNRKWVSREITANLRIDIEIITNKVPYVPHCTFVLIVIDGAKDMTDTVLANNVGMVLQKMDPSDLRLLIKDLPSSNILEERNVFNAFVKDRLFNRSYFMFDARYPLTSIDDFKEWLYIKPL